MSGVDLAGAFKLAARALRDSRINASLLRGAAGDIEADGPMVRLLHGVLDRGARNGRVLLPEELPARFAAAVHALALTGAAELAALYPSTGGHGNLHEIWPVAREVVSRNPGEVVTRMIRPSRRSDPARGAMLLAALAYLGRHSDQPVRVFDVGAGPGFALAAPWFKQDFFGETLGPADSAVHLGHPWAVAPQVELADIPPIAAATGCDLSSFDPRSRIDLAELLAWTAPDVPAEQERITAAAQTVDRMGIRVENMASSVWLPRGVSWTRTDAATVIWHSDVVLEMSVPERTELATEILATAGRANPQAPLHVVSFEPAGAEYLLYSDPVGGSLRRGETHLDPHRFELRVNSWPARRSALLATADPSGQNAHWVGSEHE
ncbi:DUF2332 family protein [Cumulibacter manganitolerans]|uniref:DUF2332 family protein n=1 Tax=Cumulibacter manganitolerans TaxID=1884992 RepID=UPI0012950407|nr:DUF2332 family protein [Cumulibacter manganitolerans]